MCVAAAAAFAPCAARAAEPTKIVLIGHAPDHPYRTHCYLPDCELLATCLRQTTGVEALVSRGWPENADLLRDADAIVLHVQRGGDFLFHPSRRDQAAELLKRGVGLCAIHWGTGAENNDVGQRWLEALGGHFHNDFATFLVRESEMRPADAALPTSRGWTAYPLREEFYIRLRFMPRATPAMLAKVDGADYPIGWTYERPEAGGGRSFGFVGGHFHDNFALDGFRRGIVNGILWTAHVDVPAGGAPCAITDDDLKLSNEFESVKK